MPTPLSQIIHVYNRLGFGISYPEAKRISDKSLNDIINSLIVTSTVATYITEIKKEEVLDMKDAKSEGMSPQEFQKMNRERLRDLNIAWIKKLLETKNVLLEKQTLFWHNHFACRIGNPYMMQELNNIHRKFAFGNFRDLLVEVAKSPAMLIYLNNQQNRKEHPNENFARELMELFTLGRGNYTESDVKDAARAFTGWAFNRENGEFEFREKQHDAGEKTIFNRKGNFGGEDVINMIMGNKQTAVFICRKMYRYYVNEKVNEAHIKELSDFYYQNQYNTGALVKKMFSSTWFYAPENMGCNIKAPVEFIVSFSRQFNVKYTDYKTIFRLQKLLGQQLFYPPNVAGWPGGLTYIDTSTLMLRMKTPSLLLQSGSYLPEGKNYSEPDEKKEEQAEKTPPVPFDWEKFLLPYQQLDEEALIKCFLIKMPLAEIAEKIKNGSGDKKEAILKIVSLPEYSLV